MTTPWVSLVVAAGLAAGLAAQTAPAVPLFDGKTLTGWAGDVATWRVEDGAIVAGSLTTTVPRNDFLVTTREYRNFVLTLEFKLEGTEGFLNSGVQFRSQRMTNPAHEMIGYQADAGAGYWGALYDESRRKRVLATPDQKTILTHVRLNDWNRYEIRAEGPRIRLTLNGVQTVDYQEPDSAIPQTGFIGLQVHGGGKALVRFRDIRIQELP